LTGSQIKIPLNMHDPSRCQNQDWILPWSISPFAEVPDAPASQSEDFLIKRRAFARHQSYVINFYCEKNRKIPRVICKSCPCEK